MTSTPLSSLYLTQREGRGGDLPLAPSPSGSPRDHPPRGREGAAAAAAPSGFPVRLPQAPSLAAAWSVLGSSDVVTW